jgi:hypothetical protein
MNDKTTAQRTRAIIIGALLFFSVIIFNIIFRNRESTPPIFLIFIVVIGLAFGVPFLRKMYTNYRVGKPEVILSQTTAVLGDKITVNLSHTFNQSVNVETLTAKLIFKETATYQQGTNTRTVHHDHLIQEYERMGSQFQSGSFYNDQFEFEIPRDGMHTLDVKRNRLRWLVQIEMDIPRMANFTQEFEIIVLPQVKGVTA